jgi:cell division cycle 14
MSSKHTAELTTTDRLYLGSYTHVPNEKTPFPYPLQRQQSKSPSKRSSRAQTGPSAAPQNHSKPSPAYFSVDKILLYNAFHADFGPLHIGHLYRFAVIFHDVLGDSNNEDRPVVFWSNADSRSKSTTAKSILK